MRKIFFLILALLILAGPAAAYDVLVLQSRHGEAYDETVRGLQSVLAMGSRVIVISDYAEIDVPRMVREDKPDLVVAVGDQALAAAKNLSRVRVVALKARNLVQAAKTKRNVTGVTMTVPPEQFAGIFRELHRQKVGVVYNPQESGSYLNRSKSVIGDVGIDLVTKEVAKSKELLDALSDLKGKVDGLWLVPDKVVATRQNAETYFRFALDQQIPLVTFSATHLGMGAAVAIDVDYFDMGRQGGEIARKVLEGTSPTDIPPASPRKFSVKKNAQVLKRLGMHTISLLSSKAP